MKIVVSLLTGIALAASTVSLAQSGGSMDTEGAVVVTIRGVVPNGGPVLVAVQSESNFAQAAATYSIKVSPVADTIRATVPGVAPGRYAVAVVQDTDQNGTFTIGDTGPTEPYGFSGRKQRGAPTFQPASIQVTERGGKARVSLTAQ